MSRRSTPERIDEARRAGTLRRLELGGMSAERAAAWLASWESQTGTEGRVHSAAEWDAAYVWITAQRG